MDKKYIEGKIKELGEWYQRIDLDGVLTTERKISDDSVWNDVKSILPNNIEGLKFLDLGCNSGFYSFMLAINGAKEVIGVDINDDCIKQAEFLKEYYEDKYGKKLNVSISNKNISDIDFDSIKKFDCILALSILYFVGRHLGGKYSPGANEELNRVIGEITKKTDMVIVRTRNKIPENSVTFYSQIFKKFDFYPTATINKKRPIVLYERKK